MGLETGAVWDVWWHGDFGKCGGSDVEKGSEGCGSLRFESEDGGCVIEWGVRKYVFMKDSILRDKKLVCIKIEQFVTVCTKRISYKNTRHISCIKLGFMRRESRCIRKTAKDFKMRVSGRLMHKKFKRSFMMKEWTR